MKLELVKDGDQARYLVSQPAEVERILRGILDAHSTVAIYAENGVDFTLSAIVSMDLDNKLLLLEQGRNQGIINTLLASPHVTCVTSLDNIRIQFSSQQIMAALFGPEPIFRLAMPEQVLRLQRRDAYRLATSVINPVKCLLNTGEGFIETVVVDISIGGVGVLAYEEHASLQAGETYHGCRIALPGSGEFALSLHICTTYDTRLKNGRQTYRAGCRFIDLPPSVETEIQRYIFRVDRERRTRYL